MLPKLIYKASRSKILKFTYMYRQSYALRLCIILISYSLRISFFFLSHAAQNVDGLMSRQRTFGFNEWAKQLICCDIANAAKRMFICWTVIGAVSFFFAILVSYQVIMNQRSQSNNIVGFASATSAVDGGSLELSNRAPEGPVRKDNNLRRGSIIGGGGLSPGSRDVEVPHP